MQFYTEKLSSLEEFKDFIRKNPNAYLCSGFFVIDKEGEDNKQHFDYYIPKKNKLFSFQLEEKQKMVPLDMANHEVPSRILKYDFDFDEIEELIKDEMKRQKIKNKIQKMLFSLQNYKGKDSLISTVFISMLGILNLNIDISNNEITDFEKKSIFSMLKIVGNKKKD